MEGERPPAEEFREVGDAARGGEELRAGEETGPAPARVQVRYGRPGTGEEIQESQVLPGGGEAGFGLQDGGQAVQRNDRQQEDGHQERPVLPGELQRRGERGHQEGRPGECRTGQDGDQAEAVHPVQGGVVRGGQRQPEEDQGGGQHGPDEGGGRPARTTPGAGPAAPRRSGPPHGPPPHGRFPRYPVRTVAQVPVGGQVRQIARGGDRPMRREARRK
ncbi:hypothetical protein JCM4914_59140 [Streptomyces platensis subsp. malvinus]